MGKQDNNGEGLSRILVSLAKNFSFLYEKYHFSIVSSSYEHEGTFCSLVLRNDTLEIAIIGDRGEIAMEFRAVRDPNIGNWMSLPMVSLAVGLETLQSSELTVENARFLKKNISAIERAFSGLRLMQTIEKVQKIAKEGANALWGKTIGEA